MKRVAVINVVGLSSSLMGSDTPKLQGLVREAGIQSLQPAFPAVTCTAQSAMLTGLTTAEHGIVGNGWYHRELAEVHFWKQSNRLVHGKKVWEVLKERNSDFTCANLFWWYNMATAADYAMTPRPLYLADGRKVFDIHTQPMEWREAVQRDLGKFPFPAFWGPGAGIASSEWIAEAAKWTEEKARPTLSLVYLPHLDYCLQKFGPNVPESLAELREIDRVAGDLIEFFREREVEVRVVSEYGIGPVSRPIHLNRALRRRGWLHVKDELGRETLDLFGSKVIAVADHQVAHVYSTHGPNRELREFLEQIEGVAEVREALDDGRSGDFVVVSEADAWFTYYFWEDDGKAPDYARTVDIHRKPGYDPVEMFLDPRIRFPKWMVAKYLLKKKLGLRGLLEGIPLDASIIRGSHGRDQVPEGLKPVIIGATEDLHRTSDVFHEIIRAVTGGQ